MQEVNLSSTPTPTSTPTNVYPFSFSDCSGFNPLYIQNATNVYIEFELRYFKRNQSYNAIKLCLYLLSFQWYRLIHNNNLYQKQDPNISIQLDKIYNIKPYENVKINDDIRTTYFYGKIKELKKDKNSGLVEINQGQINNLYLRFFFRDIKNKNLIKYLQKNQEIKYQLKKIHYPKPYWKVINIEFGAFIPYFWMVFNTNNNKWYNVIFTKF